MLLSNVQQQPAADAAPHTCIHLCKPHVLLLLLLLLLMVLVGLLQLLQLLQTAAVAVSVLVLAVVLLLLLQLVLLLRCAEAAAAARHDVRERLAAVGPTWAPELLQRTAAEAAFPRLGPHALKGRRFAVRTLQGLQ